jgi:hypothetical protein
MACGSKKISTAPQSRQGASTSSALTSAAVFWLQGAQLHSSDGSYALNAPDLTVGPVTAVPKIIAPVLYQIAQHDGMPSAGQVDKAIPPHPRAEVKRYPMDHFGPFSPGHQPAVVTNATDFMRTHLTP